LPFGFLRSKAPYARSFAISFAIAKFDIRNCSKRIETR
jgi:hypothetical protein